MARSGVKKGCMEILFSYGKPKSGQAILPLIHKIIHTDTGFRRTEPFSNYTYVKGCF